MMWISGTSVPSIGDDTPHYRRGLPCLCNQIMGFASLGLPSFWRVAWPSYSVVSHIWGAVYGEHRCPIDVKIHHRGCLAFFSYRGGFHASCYYAFLLLGAKLSRLVTDVTHRTRWDTPKQVRHSWMMAPRQEWANALEHIILESFDKVSFEYVIVVHSIAAEGLRPK